MSVEVWLLRRQVPLQAAHRLLAAVRFGHTRHFAPEVRCDSAQYPAVGAAKQPEPQVVHSLDHVSIRVHLRPSVVDFFALNRNSLSSRVTQVFHRCSEISPRPLQSVHLSGSWPWHVGQTANGLAVLTS
jgi:hypothetical protein